jgi:diguanylate cyclase (GGDEF)-like protein/PAS domain S-box-containing protein
VSADAVQGPERELLGAFDHAPIGMAILSPSGRIRRVNPALGRLLGRDVQALVDTTLFEVTHEDDVETARLNCWQIQSATNKIVRHECRMHTADGDLIHVLVSTARVGEADDEAAYLVMHLEDISERKALEARLIQQSLHDGLTGLANRTQLLDRLQHALRRAERSGNPMTVLFVDLNGFKEVNDLYGHAAGDELLRQLAQRITALLRPADTAARIGGDEFAVLCEDTDAQEAAVIAGRLELAARTPFALDGRTVTLSAAVGTSSTGSPAELPIDADTLLRAADAQMYRAKRSTGATLADGSGPA